MLERLTIALAQVKSGNTTKNLKCVKEYILCVEQMKLLKTYATIKA